ncbi:MAG TPA: aminodeoxychorismate lyase [Pseudomonadaceae bacterium]|nr:aminodeoxychorismate lyase [Pseudomonadaceae bacterium]
MLINGQTSDTVRADDRGLAYGDGLFETLRVCTGQILLLQEHLQRLQHGAGVLGIPCNLALIRQWLDEACRTAPAECVLKLVLTRGSGGRGYRPPADAQSTCIISQHALPELSRAKAEQGVAAFLCQQRLAAQPVLAGIKHLNRLEQVLASREFVGKSCFEGLMADYRDLLIEGTRSNVFVSLAGQWLTPCLSHSGVHGVLRRRLLDSLGTSLQQADIPLQDLHKADELFVANSVFGVVPIAGLQLGDKTLAFRPGPFTAAAQDCFEQVLASCS